jgi:eukaryotic-like serine/threonine-protein kinase
MGNGAALAAPRNAQIGIAMTPERWQQVKDLLAQALQIPPEERGAFLNGVCNSDQELHAEIVSLLSEQELVRSQFLQSPPRLKDAGNNGDESCEPDGALRAGLIFVERFQLIRKLGEGGMGQVWLAEQTSPVRRQVALKLIKAGMYDESVVKRFQAERQSLAIMDHPAIAKVFDAGTTPQGQPFFVMEYVPGLPITEYCDEKKLKIADRLELFIQACEGVQHAHQKAIIHRDLKPANILVVEVDGKPVPRVIDFGLAKATTPQVSGETMFTQIGHFVGTPGYMSPEQADPSVKDIDTRTDVYSLGAVLYVLLVGSQPFATKAGEKLALHELLRKLREEEPPTPSTRVSSDRETSSATAEARGTEPKQLVSLLRGDLDWITMKALERDRSRRYGAASELAADIRRCLNHEAIIARPASATYRLRKYVRRHRVAVVVSAGLVMSMAAFSILEAVQLRHITRERTRANQQAAVTEAVNDFLQKDLLFQAGAFFQSGPSRKSDPDLKVRTVLDRAAARIEGKFTKQPDVEASIRYTIGWTYLDLGLYPEARKHLERAVELHRRVLGADDARTLKSMTSLGWVAVRQGKYAEAEALDSQALEAQRRALGPEHRDTLSSMNDLAAIYAAEGKYAQAEALHTQTLEIQKRVLGPEDRGTLLSMLNLAAVYSEEGKYAQAEALDAQTLEIQKRVLGPEHPETLLSASNLAEYYSDQGKFAQAEALHTHILEIRKRVLGPEHQDTLRSMSYLGVVYDHEGKYAQAESLHTQTLEMRKRVLGPEHRDTLWSMHDLAVVYGDEGKYAQAEQLNARTLEIRRRVLGAEHPDTASSMHMLAYDYSIEGKYPQAERLCIQTLEIQRRVLGPEHPETLTSMTDLATIYDKEGKYPQAEQLAVQTLEIQKRVLGPEHPSTAVSLYNLGCAAARRGDKDRAIALLSQSVDHGLSLRLDLGMEQDRDLAPLHGDSRFAVLVAHANQVAEAKQKSAAAQASP